MPVDQEMMSAGASMELGNKVFAPSDWKAKFPFAEFNGWLTKVIATERNITSTTNPAVESNLEAVEKIRDEYRQKLQDAFEKERPRIEEIVKNDTDVRTAVEEIRTTGDSIKNHFTLKAAALDDADAAADAAAAAVADQQRETAQKSAEKAKENLGEVQAQKTEALKNLMEVPELIKSGIELAEEASKNPAKAAASKASALAEKLVIEAYKMWAEKRVSDQYDVKIKNLQFKIKNLQSDIERLTEEAAASKAADAAKRANGAAKRVKAEDGEIQNLITHIENTRKTLAITIRQKYSEISTFRLQNEATQALQEPLRKYLKGLQDSKAALADLKKWRMYHDKLTAIGLEESGLGFLNPAKPGEPKPSFPQPGTVRPPTPADEMNRARSNAQRTQFTTWLMHFGAYVETEDFWLVGEIEKVVSGGYLDFVQEIDAKLVGML